MQVGDPHPSAARSGVGLHLGRSYESTASPINLTVILTPTDSYSPNVSYCRPDSASSYSSEEQPDLLHTS